jgi:acetoin utilization deacetylase AcuC-like enzyme
LISDLEVTNLEVSKKPEFKSDLDNFVTSEADPINNIYKFYDYLNDLGFKLTTQTKDYIFNLMKNRLAKENEEIEPNPLPEQIQLEDVNNNSEIDSKCDKKIDEKMIVIIYNPNHINHYPEVSSPEMPERIIKIIDLLKNREKIFNEKCRLISDFKPGSEEDLLKIHTKNYIQFVKDYAKKGGGFLGDSTYITRSTHEIALLAVGGAIRASEEVINGKSDFALALIRPPGHHASKDKYGGYCIYNNAAVLARYLQNKKKMKKILILDWDAHAANGTMDIFYDDPSVMLISIHQDPHNYYPKTGFLSQMGKSKGLGYTINVEMPRGSGDEEYFTVLNELICMRNFSPISL